MELITNAPAGTRPASRTVALFIVAVITVLVLAWAARRESKHVMWSTPAGHQIAHVVRGAAGVNEELLTPPQAYRNTPVTAAKMDVLSHAAHRRLADYYTGPLLARWRSIAAQALDASHLHGGKTSAWISPWRIDWVHLGELTLSPRSATATATEEAKSDGVINRVNYTWKLVRTRIGWRINQEDWTFPSGSGP